MTNRKHLCKEKNKTGNGQKVAKWPNQIEWPSQKWQKINEFGHKLPKLAAQDIIIYYLSEIILDDLYSTDLS